MKLRLRGPAGVSTLTFEDDATVGDLRAQIKEKTSLTKYDVKYGYPPIPLTLASDAALLSSLDVKLHGQQLMVTSQSSIEDGTPQISKDNAVAPRPTTSFDGPKHNASLQDEAADAPPLRAQSQPISLKHKTIEEKEVPEIPLPLRGATLGMFMSLSITRANH